MNRKRYFIYILTNKSNNLYIGVTNNLIRRVYEYKNKLSDGFAAKYNLNKLIYFEEFNSVVEAITREKQIKGWTRKKKINQLKTKNPKFEEIDI